MLHTTFRKAREAGACVESYKKFARYVGGVKQYGQETPIALSEVIKVNGLEDALWCLNCVMEPDVVSGKIARLFACDCAEHTLPIYEKQYPKDNAPRKAIEVARRYALGEATDKELDAAWDAAWDAARAAGAAGDAARAARDAWDAEEEWQAKCFLEYLNLQGK